MSDYPLILVITYGFWLLVNLVFFCSDILCLEMFYDKRSNNHTLKETSAYEHLCFIVNNYYICKFYFNCFYTKKLKINIIFFYITLQH